MQRSGLTRNGAFTQMIDVDATRVTDCLYFFDGDSAAGQPPLTLCFRKELLGSGDGLYMF